jgi:hypothetical protein
MEQDGENKLDDDAVEDWGVVGVVALALLDGMANEAT